MERGGQKEREGVRRDIASAQGQKASSCNRRAKPIALYLAFVLSSFSIQPLPFNPYLSLTFSLSLVLLHITYLSFHLSFSFS